MPPSPAAERVVTRLRVLVAGCGRMGAAHARAYREMPGFEIAGLVARRPDARDRLAQQLGVNAVFSDFTAALAATRPDAVCIATYPDTHERFSIEALRAGAHVFVEKPMAQHPAQAERVIAAARENGRALVVGYILRHHPAWTRFVALARTLGSPLVMRISQNQPSSGEQWQRHLQILATVSPIVDCAVHYVDVMSQMTASIPTYVHAIGARLSPDLPEGMYNYGQLQVRFEDGSVGWYEAGWGPMMSEAGLFIKDVVGPGGSITLTQRAAPGGGLASVFVHHPSALDGGGRFLHPDETTTLPIEPSLADLCRHEQDFFEQAIREGRDLTAHHADALRALRIVTAADHSIRHGGVVALNEIPSP
jgi:predicted dehydrogenase